MCVALAALDAVVRVQGPKGERELDFTEFHRLPGDHPEKDTNLEPDELITAVDLPNVGWAKKSHYLKVRDRASYAFALVSVAAALEIEDGKIKTARVAMGGVAHKPWRSKAAEEKLVGEKPDRRRLQGRRPRRAGGREGLQIQQLQDRTGQTQHRPRAAKRDGPDRCPLGIATASPDETAPLSPSLSS